jgi:NADH:ubiquinone oxidoreductase subunit 5 (subunit L)/multisubunit Na+/H+ antiporter MnhA subunit
MEGPTPVSSLIHSATMVAAGLILLCKCNGLLQQFSNLPLLVMLIGLVSSLLASIESICLFDYKSILAGSTCDQLGFMFLVYGVGNVNLSLFQFYTHAFYKSLLFLSLGILIHQSGEQESRLFSILYEHNPVAVIAYNIGLFSLVGAPGTISHYSKSLILNTFYTEAFCGVAGSFWLCNQFTQTITSASVLLGSISFLTLSATLPVRKTQLVDKLNQISGFMILPIFCLSVGTLVIGSYLANIFYCFSLYTFITNNCTY